METTESWTWGRWTAVGVASVAGAGLVWWSASSLFEEKQPPAMPPEKFAETFKEADKVDKENWNRMWRDAGKKPPPAR